MSARAATGISYSVHSAHFQPKCWSYINKQSSSSSCRTRAALPPLPLEQACAARPPLPLTHALPSIFLLTHKPMLPSLLFLSLTRCRLPPLPLTQARVALLLLPVEQVAPSLLFLSHVRRHPPSSSSRTCPCRPPFSSLDPTAGHPDQVTGHPNQAPRIEAMGVVRCGDGWYASRRRCSPPLSLSLSLHSNSSPDLAAASSSSFQLGRWLQGATAHGAAADSNRGNGVGWRTTTAPDLRAAAA